ncbi:hypothetical protein [Xanthovirga aplysinae]|uniref:hypothetical protein n=1 Tax=Xanthovirga aplysinae TaxID=2529853 RepID=UPI0012BC814B|nr:hypothetical protein [Xanthovirga aplysinae]MTI31996.1 hypothetical protein [Xanthovirga aplysinae]
MKNKRIIFSLALFLIVPFLWEGALGQFALQESQCLTELNKSNVKTSIPVYGSMVEPNEETNAISLNYKIESEIHSSAFTLFNEPYQGNKTTQKIRGVLYGDDKKEHTIRIDEDMALRVRSSWKTRMNVYLINPDGSRKKLTNTLTSHWQSVVRKGESYVFEIMQKPKRAIQPDTRNSYKLIITKIR